MAYTWAQFKTLVRTLISDAAIDDVTATQAVSHYVKANIALQVDKNASLAQAHNGFWTLQKDRLLGYSIVMNAAALRTAVDKLLTVDGNRAGIAEASGFIDTLLAQARSELSGSATWYDNQIRQAVIDLQHYIEFLRKGHETIYDPDDVTEDSEASVGELPEECRPQDAYYVKTGEQCARIPVEQYDWQNRFDLTCGSPRMTGSQFYMALDPNGRSFILFPMLMDGHYLSLSWDGTKIEFADAEAVPFDEGCAEAVAQYVQWKMSLRPASLNRQLAEIHRASYVLKRKQVYSDSREKNRLRFNQESPQPTSGACGASCAVQSNDEDQVEFVFLADSGETPLTNTEAVVALAKSIEPDFIVHGGDANYPTGDQATFHDQFLTFFQNFIGNGDFYQAWGNRDLAGIADGQYGKPLLDVLPAIAELSTDKLYYKVTRGPLNFFFYNSGYSDSDIREPDGVAVGSTQADWLQSALAEATSGINIVVMHRAPWSSDVTHTPGSALMQALHLKTWGAHLVLSGHGHNYERLLIDGLPHVVCGLGGATKRGFGAVVSGSQFRYNDKYGCLKITGTATKVKVAFYNTDKEVIDSLTVEVE